MSTIEKKVLAFDKNVVRPGKYLDNKEVDYLIRSYKHEKWADNSDRMGKDDAISAWTTVDELQEMLDTVKMHGGNGVRFHFGAYERDYADDRYAGRQTIVMIGTRSKDGTFATSKEIHVMDGAESRILAYGDIPLCPALCNPWPPTTGLGVTLVDRGEKGMQVI